MSWKRSRTENAKSSSNDLDSSTATVERWKKSVGNSKSLAKESARSKRRRCAKCGIQPGFGSWKVFLKRREFDHNFDPVRAQLRGMQTVEWNGQHGTSR